MSQLVASNPKVLSQLVAARNVVNLNCSMRLFANSFAPGPGALLTDFAESSFSGYARINTTGYFAVPLKVSEGVYQSDSAPFVFTPAVTDNQVVWGWLLCSGSTWLYAQKFEAPVTVIESVPISIVLALTESALSLCDC